MHQEAIGCKAILKERFLSEQHNLNTLNIYKEPHRSSPNTYMHTFTYKYIHVSLQLIQQV